MKIFIGADHAGFELKNILREHLFHNGFDVEDLGAQTLDNDDDYPKYAYNVSVKVIGQDDGRGVLICGSGQGMSIAANRLNGIRATLAWDVNSAKASKEDDDSNILVLPARFIDTDQAIEMLDVWLGAEFKSDPKYKRRLDELGDI